MSEQKKRRWTKDEIDGLLSEIQAKRKKNEVEKVKHSESLLNEQWTSVAASIGGYWTVEQCRNKWRNILQREQRIKKEEEKVQEKGKEM